ncbi:hypothetical protein [Pontibacter virosus]|uniref:Uncharacterized protein n=1 Tax=Pontibacter virosus TaxID=1765052 RepID=A0A2U1ALP5_9BACT|nr:hypothetical protein [Pontibacter virosus]PVY37310.1 hypothetical protein C8E01_1211 [Pontibacter virosus]
MLLKKLKQEKFDADYQGATITTFSFEGQIEVIDFINSDYFRIDCTRDDIKEKPLQQQNNYLKPAFNLEKLSIEDFRALNLSGLISFFDKYAAGEWGESDREDFIVVWNELRNHLSQLGDSFTFFLISKEWFENQESRKNSEKADIKLKEPEFWIYGYYFIVVGISKAKNDLIAIVMFYD